MDTPVVLGYDVQNFVYALATLIGAYGGFPSPPAQLAEVFNKRNELFKWLLLVILVWQGGAKHDLRLAGLVVGAVFAAHQVLDN